MSMENGGWKISDFLRNSVGIKIITIALLLGALMIPMSMVESLVREREWRRASVTSELSEKWGKEQTISGPILTIPYKKYYNDNTGKSTYSIEYMHFLPKILNISGILTPEVRYRSIYEVVLYNSNLKLDGRFEYPRFEELGVSTENILWSSAVLVMGISDMRGINDSISITMNKKSISFQPGIDSKDIFNSGVSAKVELPENREEFTFSLTADINGSQAVNFVPIGETTTVALSSDWSSPSFTGAFLPNEREISVKGFHAKWKIFHLNRNFPQQWKGSGHCIENSSFGVKLFIAADVYQKTMRTVKYALMFMVLTFSAFFFSEISDKKRIHPIQYLMVGLAITIFYSMLISISEHITFGIAYLISSIAIILLITGYSNGIFRSKKLTCLIFGILTTLYGYLYIVLQLEDYALLIGSIGLFTTLSAVMYFTRKVDWYGLTFEKYDRN
ncbi:MAG: cell envelope integrity protein CreD [Desulfobulbaceae bacterium]|nr:cell envelope integrity protein CreD [Desulfobulbaceae bacterium]